MFAKLVYFLFRAGVEVLFNELEIPEEEFSFGRSKIFIRNPRTVSEKCLPLQNQAIFHEDSLLGTA